MSSKRLKRASDAADATSDSPRAGRKLAQLCEQASEALSYALAGSADAALRDLSVASVTPAPDATRLLVTVYTPEHAQSDADQAAILARLDAARGYLRSEVAGAVHRKRAPDLAFALARTRSSDPGAGPG